MKAQIPKEKLDICKLEQQYCDLDHLAGTWSEQDYAEFTAVVADFDKVENKTTNSDR